MYQANGIYYTEEHSVSFGSGTTAEGTFTETANTWTTWHLIPSSRISIPQPNRITKFIEIPGADGAIDLSTYLTGKPIYKDRQGSMNFYIANGFENWETIRHKMMRFLHGNRLKMRINDPSVSDYYYIGRFTVGPLESGASYSTISISYQLDPLRIAIGS